MAVQKNKSSRLRRGNRRSHDSIKLPFLSFDVNRKIYYLFHHISKDGYYRGRKINK